MRNLLLFFVLISINVFPNNGDIMETLKYVETINGEYTIGDDGKAFGILQIHKGYVEDVNRYHGTSYTHYDMFDDRCAEEVFYLYMEIASERFCKKYGRYPNEEEIVRMHNGGMYQGYRIKATEKYYKKYLWWKRKLKNEGKI